MKITEIMNESTSGATSAGSIASVNGAIGGVQRRNPDGTAINALDMKDTLFGDVKKPNKKKKKQ
jgi:hypothetical protein